MSKDLLNPKNALGLAFWLFLGGVTLIVIEGNDPASVKTFAAIGILHSAIVFLIRGRSRVTTTGVFCIGTAVFIYYPALIVAIKGSTFAGLASSEAVQLAYFAQVFICYGTYRTTFIHTYAQVHSHKSSRSLFFTGMVLIGGGILAEVMGIAGTLAETLLKSITFVGVVLVAVSAVSSGTRITIWRLGLVVSAIGVYVAFMFTGGGRLVLGTLALTILLALNIHTPKVWQKLATLIAIPIGLNVLTAHRSDLVAAERGGQESGFESVIWPFERYAQLLQMTIDGDLPLGMGRTFVAPLTILVPRSFWENKPIGFGAELTKIFRPELSALGHSEAALMYGEFLYNFGIFGIALAVPVIAISIRAIDSAIIFSASQGVSDERTTLRRVVVVLLAAGLLDFVWVGLFGYTSRTGYRLIIVAILYLALFRNTPSQLNKRANRVLSRRLRH